MSIKYEVCIPPNGSKWVKSQDGWPWLKSANKTIESKWAKKSQFGSEQLYYVNCQIVIFVMYSVIFSDNHF